MCQTNQYCKWVQIWQLHNQISASSLCQVSGDPHILSFDGEAIHYQGDCVYVLSETSKDLDIKEETPDFQVVFKGEHRKNSKATWVQYIEVKIYGVTVRMDQDNVVTVSTITTINYSAPAHLSSQIFLMNHEIFLWEYWLMNLLYLLDIFSLAKLKSCQTLTLLSALHAI